MSHININMNPWNEAARLKLREILVRRKISYKRLVFLLSEIGVDETERAIQGKMARGTFSFAFFLQCMRALGINSIDL
jgi:hypothetical protein